MPSSSAHGSTPFTITLIATSKWLPIGRKNIIGNDYLFKRSILARPSFAPQGFVSQVVGDRFWRRHPALADPDCVQLSGSRQEPKVRVTDAKLGRRLSQRDVAAFFQWPPGPSYWTVRL